MIPKQKVERMPDGTAKITYHREDNSVISEHVEADLAKAKSLCDAHEAAGTLGVLRP